MGPVWPARGRATETTPSASLGASYDIADAVGYDYSASGVNEYYCLILDKAASGWPARLGWLRVSPDDRDPPGEHDVIRE